MNRFIQICILLFLSSCSNRFAALQPSITNMIELSKPIINSTSSLTPSQIYTPSSTTKPLPTHTTTASLSPTLFPPLNNQGPYLVFSNIPSPYASIILLNPDGTGQKAIPLPNKTSSITGYSPEGHWAMLVNNINYTGDITLSLLHLPDGNIKFISTIISEEAKSNYWWDDCPLPTSLFQATAWSPDGRYLAFSANTTGTSFDLFTYDTEGERIRRLTNHSADILSIYWSFDSKTIYYLNGVQPTDTGDYTTYTVNETNIENKPNQGIRTLFTSSESLLWYPELQRNRIIVLSSEKRGCRYGEVPTTKSVTTINLNTGINKEIWSGYIYPRIAVDNENNGVLLFDLGYQSNHPVGFYIVSFEGKIISYLESLDIGMFDIRNIIILFRGGKKYSFLLYNMEEGGIFGITFGGVIEKISESEGASISVSPDKNWFVLYNDRGMDLFSKEDQFVEKLEYPYGEQLFWRTVLWHPDSDGLYFVLKESEDTIGLYYWAFSDNKSKLIKSCQYNNLECGYFNLSWVL